MAELTKENQEFNEAVAKKEMLECQWRKRQKSPSLELEPSCNECKNRFVCFSMKANRYKVVDIRTVWTTYELFGSDEDEARETFYDYGHEEKLVRELDTDGEGGEIEIDEWND